MPKTTKNISWLAKTEKIHPHLMLMYLGIGGSSLMITSFMFISSVSVFFSPHLQNTPLPKAFIFSTFLVFGCSYFVQQVWTTYKAETDSVRELAHDLNGLIWCALLFALSQCIGWNELFNSELTVKLSSHKALFYILPAIHLVHLVGGLVYALFLRIYFLKIGQNPVKALVFLSDDYAKIKIKMLLIYWHFLGVVWFIFFIYLLFGSK